MSKRIASSLAWSMCALSLTLTALSLFLLVLNLSYPDVPIHPYWHVNTVGAVTFSTVGGLIVSRRSPYNPISWLFCVTGLLFVVTFFSAEYARYALLAAPGSLPAGQAAAWLFSLVWVPEVGLAGLLFLLFPDGRLPSRRWRWFFWLSVLLILVGAISQAFAPGPVLSLEVDGIYNPLGVEGVPNAFELIQNVLFALLFISAASLFVRRLGASGVDRQQLKWFTYSVTLLISGAILTYTISEVTGALWLEWAGYVVLVVGLLGIPMFMGIAILRYRF